ncbi:MAG: hypothetical protein H6Q89_568 [Myxococcaceae bacterium]|nr:hypothetical protein [Myxococcaceae bacterium]
MLALAVAALLAAAELDGGLDPLPAPAPEVDAGVAAGALAANPFDDAPRIDAGVLPAASNAEAPDPAAGFVKGELSVYLGSDRLTVKHNRIGVSAGLDRFGQAYYLLVEPQVDLRFFDGKWGVGLGAPLRIELISFEDDAEGNPTRHLGRIRKGDWDSVHDYGRLLKYVNYGRKEDNLYVNIGQRYASTIGHGTIQRRYAANIDIDYPRVSAEVDAYNDFGGFELFTNDILAWNQLTGIAFIKPLWFLGSSNLLVKSLSIGVSGGLDWQAPRVLTTNALGVRQLDNDGRLAASQKPVGLVGVDVELKVFKNESVDLKPYVDYSSLVGGEGGLTIGALGRFNLGTQIVNAFRLVAELRILGSRYKPSYFDTFYEVERFIYDDTGTNPLGFFDYRTKQQAVLEAGLGNRTGYYFEASWGIRNAVGLTLSLEGVSNSAAKNFVAHLEVPVLSFLQLFGSYYKRRFLDFSELARLDDKTVVFAGARLRVLPFFFLSGRLYKAFRVNPDVQRYDNQFGFVIDAEVGYEFGGSKKDEPMPAGGTPATEPAPQP